MRKPLSDSISLYQQLEFRVPNDLSVSDFTGTIVSDMH